MEERKSSRQPADADEVMVALACLIDVLDDNVRLTQQAKRRARYIMQQRRRGRSYSEIVPGEDDPLVVQIMRENLRRLIAASSELQHAEAKALHEEGMTTGQIGRLFGVSQQRVSALLKRARERRT